MNFCLAFTDELEKQLFIKKLLKWSNKKCKNFNTYNVVFKKINKTKKTPRDIILYLCTKNLNDMIYSSWDIECDRLKLVVMGHSLPFYSPLKTQKMKILKK